MAVDSPTQVTYLNIELLTVHLGSWIAEEYRRFMEEGLRWGLVPSS